MPILHLPVARPPVGRSSTYHLLALANMETRAGAILCSMDDRSMEVVVKPWYRQFYLQRGDADWLPDQVSELGYATRVEAIDGFVYVGTVMYGHPTSVSIRVTDAPPVLTDDGDHVVEVSVTGEGPLKVLSWGADEPDAVIVVSPGPLRLRATWFGLFDAATHPDADVGGDDTSPERVALEVWPAPAASPVVVRAWSRTE